MHGDEMTAASPGPPPATGAWRPGDPAGQRRFLTLFAPPDGPLELELGGTLSPVVVAYETWGELDRAGSNAVLVAHALTGDSHAAGPAGPGHRYPGWWDHSIGPGKDIDTNRWFVVCPNVLGGCQGTTGPSSPAPDGRPYGSRFPRITIRDQVAVEAAMADALGIERWAAVIGGSMGGMRALEWAVGHPDRLDLAVVVACGAAASAEEIGLCSVQNEAIRADPGFRGGDYYEAAPGEGPHRGMGIARRIGHLSYRSEPELQARFGRAPQPGEDPLGGATAPAEAERPGVGAEHGRYAVESYLDHHADKLARRFDAGSYVVLSEAMNHHDVGRGRGGLAQALGGVRCRVAVAGIDSDRLYPLRLQRELAELLPGRPEVTVISSLYGHDSFLIESEAVGNFIRAALEEDAAGVEERAG
ncbi:MAG TPA: homoserine O-acetyltransferase [Acidimicrobiia bacterium]|nr:homoserine O-acetyltransferase [Acidimicrobiia bacterium]